jgi:hypothetical protein
MAVVEHLSADSTDFWNVWASPNRHQKMRMDCPGGASPWLAAPPWSIGETRERGSSSQVAPGRVSTSQDSAFHLSSPRLRFHRRSRSPSSLQFTESRSFSQCSRVTGPTIFRRSKWQCLPRAEGLVSTTVYTALPTAPSSHAITSAHHDQQV